MELGVDRAGSRANLLFDLISGEGKHPEGCTTRLRRPYLFRYGMFEPSVSGVIGLRLDRS